MTLVKPTSEPHADWDAALAEEALAERYVLGRLDLDEEARFEDHLVACPRCQDEVESARGLALGMRAVAAQEAVRRTVLARLAARLGRPGLALAGAALALLLVAGLVLLDLVGERRSLATSVEIARQEATDLRAELDRERGRRAEAERIATVAGESEGGGLTRPLAGAPVYLLALARGDEDRATTIEAGEEPIVLAVDAAPDPRYRAHRVVVTDAAGDVVFRRDGLQPDALEAVLLTFPAGYFPPGDYRLELFGELEAGASELLATHPLTVR